MSRHGAICILINPVYTIEAYGRDWHFEWHEYLGPGVLDKRGNPIGGHGLPPESSPFWGAFQRWFDAGRHVDEDGRCLFAPPSAVPMAMGL